MPTTKTVLKTGRNDNIGNYNVKNNTA
jgi:hypothetical protein